MKPIIQTQKLGFLVVLILILTSCKPYEFYYTAKTPESIAATDQYLTNPKDKLTLIYGTEYVVFCKGTIDLTGGITQKSSDSKIVTRESLKKQEFDPVIVERDGYTIIYVPVSGFIIYSNTLDALAMVPKNKKPILLEDNTGKYESIVMYKN